MKRLLIAFALVGSLHAQTGPSYFNAPALLGLVSSTGGAPFAPMATSGSSGTSYDNAQPMLLLGYNSTTGKYYVCGTANPCVSGSGGGGATIPSTTNLISGDGAGNGADSGIAPANVATLSGAQTFSGVKSFTSAAVTSTTPTFQVNDSEPGAAVMNIAKFLLPNMVNNNTGYFLLGNAESTLNSFFLGYSRVGAGSSGNRFFIQPYAVPIAFSIYATQHVVVGAGADAGYNFDVGGTMRASTSTTSPTYLTPNTYVGRSQTTALNQTIVASANTATYRISLASNCKTAVAAAAYTATVSYTDTSSTVQTVSSGSIPCDTLGTASKFNSIAVANVLTGTAISLATTTTGSVSYDVAVTAEQITQN